MPKTSRSEHYTREVSRVEGFSDAVFGFAVTLLVVSLEVPKTFDDLMLTMRGFPAFAVSFALLFQIWWRHYRFFRKYDLEDSVVITLTGLLLFVVLFYVYPLKFLWSVMFSQIGGAITEGALPGARVPALFMIYGAGVAAAYGILAALYWHAYARRADLELTASEVVDTRVEIYRNVALAGVGLLSVAIAAVTGAVAPRFVGIAGVIYFAIGINEWALGAYGGRLRRRVQSQGD
jgi:uncharacterized membrane protein